MKNLNGYWVNKRSGTIHHVLQDTDWSGNPTLWANSCNLRWDRSYHFRGDAVQRFQKKYEFISFLLDDFLYLLDLSFEEGALTFYC